MRCPALKKNVSHSLQSSPIVLPIHTRHLRGCLSLMSSVNKTKVPSVQLAPFCFHPVEIHKKKSTPGSKNRKSAENLLQVLVQGYFWGGDQFFFKRSLFAGIPIVSPRVSYGVREIGFPNPSVPVYPNKILGNLTGLPQEA